jgi:hypothetical protein
MDRILAVAAVVAFVAVWNVFWYRKSGGRLWSPLWMAFSTTTTAFLFLVSGSVGYSLSRHERFVGQTPWTGGVIWWQVAVGISAAAMALFLWRKGLTSVCSHTDGA